jgi:hypothetical protein
MRGWGRRPDSQLRQDLQRCQSRIRLAHIAIEAFRHDFMPVALNLPINLGTDLLAKLAHVSDVLAGEEGQS